MTDIYTIGHSTRSLEEFLAIVTSFKLEVLVDVRRYPHSRRHPHFNTDELKKALFQVGVKYEYLGDSLGGFRSKRKDSRHLGLRESSFQGYADHMESAEFARGLERLEAVAHERRTAVMCAEAQWVQCHRRLLADKLLVRGARVLHIRSDGRQEQHELTPFARPAGERLEYPPQQAELGV